MKLLHLFVVLFSFFRVEGQNLEKHQWKNRLIVLLSPSYQQEELLKQLRVLKAGEAGLNDRRLIIYQVSPSGYKIGLDDPAEHPLTAGAFDRFSDPNDGFALYLIGLDGGIKMENRQPVSLADIFALIDTMPMRRAELSRRRNNNND